MYSIKTKPVIVLALGLGLQSLSAWSQPATYAQEPATAKNATASVVSAHEVSLIPNRLRLLLTVKAESREGENALKILQKHQARVTKELESLNAIPNSITYSITTIKVGTPGVDDPDSARKMIRQQAAQMRNMNPGLNVRLPVVQVTEDDELPQIFFASSHLSAEWKLASGMDAAAILLPSTIKAAIEEKDFRGRKLKEELAPDEEMLIQPLTGSNVYYAANAQSPDLQLYFVAEMTEAQEEEATSMAFQKAKRSAALLAKASGRKLGAVRSIGANPSVNYPGVNYVMGYNGQLTGPSPRKSSREATGTDPGELKHSVTVNVTFELE